MGAAGRSATISDRSPSSLEALSRAGVELASPADDIRGCMVLDQAGYEVGQVEDLVIDPVTGGVFFVVVGQLSVVAEGSRLIPIDAVGRRTAETVPIDQDFEHVAEGPRYAAELVSDAGYQAGVYGWYGYVPYWHPGYVHPSGRPRG